VTAQALAQAGAAFVVAERNGKALTGAVKALKDAGHQVIGVVCDVSDETQAAAMVERSGTFGRLDMAYNSAGILGLIRPMMEETAAGSTRSSGVNLRGEWACM
jgi:NAD(P)-dependent dehydrogenase (short-subunit alcohol dehydrogenase family)